VTTVSVAPGSQLEFTPDSDRGPGRTESSADEPSHILRLGAADCVADAAGVLYWPQERTLIVSDLHLEKGSAFAVRGSLVPPYDTGDTLARLARVLGRYAPRRVISLGDNFHDGGGAARLSAEDAAMLAGLQRGRDWVWISGNHDPEPLEGIGGECADVLSIAGVTLRHIASRRADMCEISGHLHPVAIVAARGRSMRRRCFATDGRRLIMPAFGAYAGGLNVRHRAFAEILAARFTAHVLGNDRVYAIASQYCL
jgi:uncharacterized protein